MARKKGYLEEYASKYQPKTTSGTTLSSQIANARARLADIGEEKDTRNVVEKFLGLPEDQNVLFDIAELIGRPQQALFGAIKAKQEGYDVGEAALAGIKGEDFTYGGEILRNLGMEDSGDKVGLDDVLGFGLDIFADPMDLAILPVAAGAKGTKLMSGTEAVAKGAKKAVKGATKLADTGVEKLLKVSDARKGIKYLDDLATDPAKLGKTIAEGYSNKIGGLETYKGVKKQIGEAFNYRKAVPGDIVGKAARKADQADFAKDITARQFKKFDDIISNEAKLQGKTTAQLNREYKLLAQDEALKKTFSVKEMLTSGKKKTFAFNSYEDVSNVTNKLDELGVKYKPKEGNVVVIKEIPKELKVNKDLIDSLDNVVGARDLTPATEFLTEVEALKQDPALMKFYQENHPSQMYENVNRIFRDELGYNMSDADAQGFYDRLTLADTKRATGKTATFGTKKSEFDVITENARYAKETERAAARIDKEIALEMERLPERIIAKKEARIMELKQEITKFNDNITNTLKKRGEGAQRIYDSITKKANKRANIEALFTKDMLKRYERMLPGKNTDDLIKTASKLGKKEAQFIDLQKQLAKPSLSTKNVDSILNKMTKLNDELTKGVNKVESLIDNAEKIITDNSMDMIKKSTDYADNVTKNTLQTKKLNEKLATYKETTKRIAQRNKNSIISREAEIDYLKNQLKTLKKGDISTQTAIIKKRIKNLERNKKLLQNPSTDKLFTESFTETFADYINQTTEYAKGKAVLNEILLDDTLRDESLMRIVSKSDKTVPAGMVAVDGNTIVKHMTDGWGGFVNDEAITKFTGEIKNQRVLLDKSVHNMLFKKVTQKDAKEFMRIVNSTNNMFKKLKTLSPGFHMRNMIGNPTNMWLSGMPITSYGKYTKKATKLWNKTDDILSKVADGVKLTGDEAKIFETLQEFAEAGLYKSGTKVLDLDEILKESVTKSKKGIVQGAYDKVFELNAKGNAAIDGMNRMALFLYAKENPKYLKLNNVDDAGSVVRKVLFDPNDLSDFEKNTLKKFIPFYTFTKQNLFFQIDNITKNPVKYKRLIKANNRIWDGAFDENEYMQWQKEGMGVPVPFLKDSSGNPLMFKLNLPMSDLGEFMEDPTRRTLASLTPLVRAPFETVTGKEIFTGRDIDTMSNIDFIAKNTGLDIITKQIPKYGKLLEAETGGDILSTIAPSVASPVNMEQNILSNQYQEIDELQQYIKQLKDAGVQVRTINEIKEESKQRLARLKRQRKKNT